jgi:uncharacterized low-complexity protein
MADIKRVNYFTHQFLVEKDFDDEQDYHIDMRRRHNRVNHSWGVAEGLDVTKTENKKVTISPGTSIDKDGQEIVLLEPLPVDLTAFGSNTYVYLSISYQEVFDEADHYTSGGVDDYTRTTERPKIERSENVPDPLPGNGSLITLARVHLDGSGNVDAGIDNTMRKSAGSKIAPGAVSTNELANNAVTAAKIANGQVGASELANGSVTNTKLASNAVTAAKIANNSVTAAKIANGQVGASELANGSVTNAKLANNAVNAAKIADGSVGAAELANDSVSAQKLKTKLCWDSTTSIGANGERGFNCLAVPLTKPRGASLLIYAYSTTNKAKFEWREQSTTGGPSPYWINQTVFFHNLTNITISIKFKIYEILEA